MTTVAAFDFDGTLTRGGSVWHFLVAISGRRRVVGAALALAGPLAAAALFGGRFADEAKQALFRRTLAGLPVDELTTRAAAFGLAHYRCRARADIRQRLEWHRARGHHLLLVSASPEIYLAAVGVELGVDAVLATRLAVGDDGRLTGVYRGHNCRGQEKLARVREWMTDTTGETTAFLWAYGNSKGDRRMLAGADVGVDVGRLGRLGALRAFPRLSDLADNDGADNDGADNDGAVNYGAGNDGAGPVSRSGPVTRSDESGGRSEGPRP
jgi:phosphatidylglycerophosphatase C